MSHARNVFNANVWNLYHDGNYQFKINNYNFDYNWGIKHQLEIISDEIREWVMIDSAGYSISPINSDLHLYEFYKGNSSITSNRLSSYMQIANEFQINKSDFNWILGTRTNYWDFNNEWFLSPRMMFSIKPNWNKDFVFNLSCGSYNQSPFSKDIEMLKDY